ncbi:MAG: response regulator [Chloroflexi bacterium]|nr:response regulator [Chloroflexota bacterium]
MTILPVASTIPMLKFASSRAATSPFSATDHTLLVVDDEVYTLHLLELLFRHDGYRVLTASSAEEGLDVLGRHQVSLVISDERLPGMRGVEFLMRVRQNWPDTFRIILTAYADTQAVINSINDGHVYRFITKPWDNNDLRQIVRDALRRFDITKENRRLNALILQQFAELRTMNESLEQKVAERTAEVETKNRHLQETMLEVVRTLSGILEMRGVGAKGHALHVSQACDWVAGLLALSAEQRLELGMAAMLHDIGKVGLPDELLRKDSMAYTRTETAVFREYCVLGQSIISGIRQLENVGRIIRHQREWWNGAGFPDGLAEEQIPIESRIIAAVDAYEERPDQALLEQGSGRRFDPEVVTAFVAYLADRASVRGESARAMLPHELREGMILMNDVYTGRGLLLCTGGKAIDKTTLEKIRNFNRVDPILGKIYVRG